MRGHCSGTGCVCCAPRRAQLLAIVPRPRPRPPAPPSTAQGICSVIYAGERVSTDLQEVNAVAKMLISKYRCVCVCV